MKTLEQHLNDQPLITLQTIAKNQGLVIESSEHGQFVEDLVSQLLVRAQINQTWEMLSSADQAALRFIVAEGNRVPVATFQRRFGVLRRYGSGRLLQDKPWLKPTGPAERLWYRGLITRGYDETPESIAEFITIPTDLLPFLPLSEASATEFWLPQAVEKPGSINDEGERLLDDLATLLIYVQNQQVWLNRQGQWRDKDLHALLPQWQVQPSDLQTPLKPGQRTHFIWHLAQHLGFLKTQKRRQFLSAEFVNPWLSQERPRQAQLLFHGWRGSSDWNDLCSIPTLQCDQGNWRNDPVIARRALLDILGHFPSEQWYRLEDLVTAIYEQRPDFQRPDGNYETWYIRNEEGTYLKGYESWNEVEQALIGYVWTGPLFWLGITKLDEVKRHWCLTERGAAYLGQAPAPEQTSPPLVITADFRVQLPIGARIQDRFRVARFCTWEASWPGYRYQITQRGLRRASSSGISPDRILDFLTEASDDKVPSVVRKALNNFRP